MLLKKRDDGSLAPIMGRREPEMRLTGRTMKGYQASDLLAAMTNPEEARRQKPKIKVPRIMIESFRVEGEDDITARDHALYMALMAWARFHGMEAETHTIPVSTLLQFLRVRPNEGAEKKKVAGPKSEALRSIDRLVESLQRIGGTTVSYSLQLESSRRKRAQFPLVIFETDESVNEPLAGGDTVTFSFPFPIRRTIMVTQDSMSWGRLELCAFPHFRSRYTPRLYSRLALRAGETLPRPWTVNPKELAEELGWPMGSWHYPSWRRDCLLPMLADIAAHVTGFKVAYEETRGTGRGRPVESITFAFTAITKKLAEAQRSHAFLMQSSPTYQKIVRTGSAHTPDEMPDIKLVLQAARMLAMQPVEVALAWKQALDKAKSSPAERLSDGTDLTAVMEKDGVGAAFEAWVQTLEFGKPVTTSATKPPRPCPPPHRSQQPVPVAAPVAYTPFGGREDVSAEEDYEFQAGGDEFDDEIDY